MYNFKEHQVNVATLLQRSDDPAYLPKIKQWLNFAQEYAFRTYDYFQELEETWEFYTAASIESCFLPSSFDKPLRFFDFTNNRSLRIVTEEAYEEVNISNISSAKTGIPDQIRLFGISPINYIIPITGITVKAKSSSALDTSGIVVHVEGYIDSALTVIDSEDITISTASPTTFVAASSPKTFYKFTKIVKSVDTYGYVTIANSASATIAIIASNERASRYPVVNFGIIPNGVFKIRCLGKKRVAKLVNDNDYSFIDADEFFTTYAYAYGLSEEKEMLERAAMMFAKAKDVLSEVIRNEQTRLGENYQHKMVSKSSQVHRV
jgi:hypothetical protein